ncbi:hypothetical protein PILCRDRAFT_11859 [Piloderma croceum F 1598]|uniref:SNF2 N-terminal domain-containing protein n=1 Tax=Piloderma croceum (strain F 1598) TaxID=765440 RepID=A0A0C3AUL7_PILCF|nr:hypothetical protein PILCRDRAFT_11859 [Piloderma croceum F 1598]
MYSKHNLDIANPHLTIVPKSTIQNWSREFNQWTPDLNIIILTGPTEESELDRRGERAEYSLVYRRSHHIATQFLPKTATHSCIPLRVRLSLVVDNATKSNTSLLNNAMRVFK